MFGGLLGEAETVERESTTVSIEVPFEGETTYAPDTVTAVSSDSTVSGDDRTHLHFVAVEPGVALYRHQELQAVIDRANETESVELRRLANQKVMEQLANLGVSVYLISYECEDVWKEIRHCIFEASNMHLWNCSRDRCLLFEDEKGRLFNLLAAGDFNGLAGSYDAMIDQASGLEAMCAFVILIRAFACVGTCSEGYTSLRVSALRRILGIICDSLVLILSISIYRITRRHSSRLYCPHFRFGLVGRDFQFLGEC